MEGKITAYRFVGFFLTKHYMDFFKLLIIN